MNREALTDEKRNVHRVPQAQWRKWRVQERITFNYMFSLMTKNQDLFLTPGATVPKRCWRTTAWNTAWITADCVRDARRAA